MKPSKWMKSRTRIAIFFSLFLLFSLFAFQLFPSHFEKILLHKIIQWKYRHSILNEYTVRLCDVKYDWNSIQFEEKTLIVGVLCLILHENDENEPKKMNNINRSFGELLINCLQRLDLSDEKSRDLRRKVEYVDTRCDTYTASTYVCSIGGKSVSLQNDQCVLCRVVYLFLTLCVCMWFGYSLVIHDSLVIFDTRMMGERKELKRKSWDEKAKWIFKSFCKQISENPFLKITFWMHCEKIRF